MFPRARMVPKPARAVTDAASDRCRNGRKCCPALKPTAGSKGHHKVVIAGLVLAKAASSNVTDRHCRVNCFCVV